ncbi:MAG: TonB-dependent receptor [Labilithrix sp.]|nr:TonB-dependent receptor [Labilithrix sp.]
MSSVHTSGNVRPRCFLLLARGVVLRLALAATALAFTSSPAIAFAQQPAPANEVVPPKLTKDSPALYPEQALREKVAGRVVVNLILEIDPSGKVKTATIPEPVGHGFDEAAASAASGLAFEPATRGGAPIAAKIRFSYTFDPPAARVTGKVLRPPNDVPIEGATVVVTDATGEHRVTTGKDGAYRVEGLAAGKVHIHVEARGRTPQDLDEEIGAGEEAEVVLRLAVFEEAPPPTVPGKPGEPEEAIEEVRVKGERPPREVTKRSIPREEINVIPGTNGDALRSLQNLPGVARPPPFGGQLVVRGSAPQDTNYFVDGTNIPLIYHFGGLSSVLPTEVLDHIDFYPGNYGAQYGRGMGGIVDVAVRGPKDDGRMHGMAQVDLIDARFVAERSLGKGWSFMLGGRRSYFDLWLGPILASAAGVSTAPRYYDYQVMLKKELGPDHELRFFFFGSDDRLQIFSSDLGGDFVLGGGIRAVVTFWRAQMRYTNKLNADTRVTAVAAVGQDYVNFGFGPNYLDLTTTPISLRAEVSRRLARAITLNAGIDAIHTPFNIAVRFPVPQRPGVPDSGLNAPSVRQDTSGTLFTPGVYSDLEIVPLRGTRIVPGIRADYFKFAETDARNSSWNFSPRVVVRQDLTTSSPKTTVKGGVGVFHQPPQAFEMDKVFGRPNLTSNRAIHYTAGLEQEVGAHVTVSVEGFYKALDNLVVQGLGNTGDGRVYGSEWLLRWQKDPKMFGWIAYTLMRSERREKPDDLLRLFDFDQTHILTAILSRNLGHGWRVGGRFRLVSGNLYTPSNYGALDADRAVYQPVSSMPLFGERLGTFHQLDFRVDKEIDAKPLKLSIYLDIQNIYFHRSQEGISYNYNYVEKSPVLGLPILPILGLRGDLL